MHRILIIVLVLFRDCFLCLFYFVLCMYICNVFIKFNKAAVFEGHKTPQDRQQLIFIPTLPNFSEKSFYFLLVFGPRPHTLLVPRAHWEVVVRSSETRLVF